MNQEALRKLEPDPARRAAEKAEAAKLALEVEMDAIMPRLMRQRYDMAWKTFRGEIFTVPKIRPIWGCSRAATCIMLLDMLNRGLVERVRIGEYRIIVT